MARDDRLHVRAVREPPKAVLVTGGAGYIGAHVCRALHGAGYLPVTLDNLTIGHRSAVRWGPLCPVDLWQEDRVADVIHTYGVDSVVHCAGRSLVGESASEPALYFQENVGITTSLLKAVARGGARNLLFSSTASVYGNPDRTPITEQTATAPVNPYGGSKLAAEHAIRWTAAATGLRCGFLRYFNAAGASPDGDIGEWHEPETHLVPNLVSAALSGKPFSMFGCQHPTRDGTALRDFVHVCDLAIAHVRALRVLENGSDLGAVNIATGSGTTVAEMIAAAERVLETSVEVDRYSPRPGDPPALIADPSPARDLLDWEPTLSTPDRIIRDDARFRYPITVVETGVTSADTNLA